MAEFSEGQWVRIKNGVLEGLVGQVLSRKPEGRLLLAIGGGIADARGVRAGLGVKMRSGRRADQ